MLVEGGERALRCVKIEVPSSPAPRTRILVEDMLVVRDMAGVWFGIIREQLLFKF